MIAVDSSSLIDFLNGAKTPDTDHVRNALRAGDLWLPPPVKTEVLSGRVHGSTAAELVDGVRLLPIAPGFWERAGVNRQQLILKGLRARLADTLIAQCCIDADVSLIARDRDYRHFEAWFGLRLVR